MDTAATTTRDQLVKQAQHLISQRGCNGFSYRDLADYVGVKTSSIHYYFPTKDDLVMESICAYAKDSAARRAAIPSDLPASERLQRFIAALEGKLRDGSMLCLGGALAADFECVPGPVQKAIAGFYAENEAWLAGVLAEGQAQGNLNVPGDPAVMGRVLFAAMQGAAMTSRLFADFDRVRELTQLFCVKV